MLASLKQREACATAVASQSRAQLKALTKIRSPARAGRKLEVGHAAGTRPEKNALLAGREGGQIQCRRCGRHSAQPEEQNDAERLGPEPDCFCPLAGWLRRLELLVDLIRNRLAALIDP